MRKINLSFSLLLSMAMGMTMTSCSSSDEDESIDPDVTKGIYIISDKNEVEASGKDIVTFKVVDNNGVDLTSKSYIKNVNTNVLGRKGVNTYTYTSNETIRFTARYEGDFTDTIEVKFQNRKKYELYKKNVALFKVTGTWCAPCYSMLLALKEVEKDMPGKFIEMAFHASSTSGTDPFEMAATGDVFSTFGMVGFPSVVYDMKKSSMTTNSSTNVIKSFINGSFLDNPAICSVKMNTSYNQESKSVTIDASIISDKGGDFELGYLLLRDNLLASQNGADGTIEHNNTVVAVSENFLGSSNKITLKAGDEHTALPVTLSTKWDIDPSNTRVVVYAITKINSEYLINNIVECKIGESTEYVENAD